MMSVLPEAPGLPAIAADSTPPLRVLSEDGTLHFSALKKLALSGTQYLHAVNSEVEPTRDMLVGTVTHFLLFGPRPGAKPIVLFKGGSRRGGKWEDFRDEHAGTEIVTQAEWGEAEQMAESVRHCPVARNRLVGARFEVPLRWEERGIPCSTSGIDIVTVGEDVGDLKTTATTFPEAFQRHAFRMLYPQQLAFYRRGARANGIKVRDLFVLGVERKAPFEVVELTLTEEMVDFADKSLALWIEKLRGYMLSIPAPQTFYDWPGYAQSPIPWSLPSWMHADAVDDDEEAAA